MASIPTPLPNQPATTFTSMPSATPTPFEPSTITTTPNPYPPSSSSSSSTATPPYLVAIIAIIGFFIVAGGVISWLKLSASRAKEQLHNQQRQEMDPEVGPNMLVPIEEWKAVGSRGGDASSIEEADTDAEMSPPPRYSERVG